VPTPDQGWTTDIETDGHAIEGTIHE